MLGFFLQNIAYNRFIANRESQQISALLSAFLNLYFPWRSGVSKVPVISAAVHCLREKLAMGNIIPRTLHTSWKKCGHRGGARPPG